MLLALLSCKSANLACKKRKVKPDPKCHNRGLLRERAHAFASTSTAGGCQGFCSSPGLCFAVFRAWGMLQSCGVRGALPAETVAVPAPVSHRAAWAGVRHRHSGCCFRGKGGSSRGPVLVTSFLQRILESSNKIRNRLRYAAGLSCETCLP